MTRNSSNSFKPTMGKRMGFPVKLTAKLRYASLTKTLNPGVGGVCAIQIFSANGLYDPDISGVGHQPMGFDQYMDAYREYTVKKAKITVYFRNKDTTNDISVGIVTKANTVVLSSGERYVEQGNCVYARLPADPRTGSSKTLTYSVDIGKFMSLDPLDEVTFSGSVAANPAAPVLFDVIAWSANGVDTGSCEATAVIDYDVIFNDPRALAQS